MAKPKIIITDDQWKIIENAAAIFCTGEEIAGLLEIDYDTLNARVKEKYKQPFSDYIKRLQGKGKMSLRRAQYKAAVEDKNTGMLIWLGKQYLGQTDKQELFGKDGAPINIKWILPVGTNAKR